MLGFWELALLCSATSAVIQLVTFERREPILWTMVFVVLYVVGMFPLGIPWYLRAAFALLGVYGGLFAANFTHPRH